MPKNNPLVLSVERENKGVMCRVGKTFPLILQRIPLLAKTMSNFVRLI